MGKRGKEEVENTERTFVFKVEGYVQATVDMDDYEDATKAVASLKEELMNNLESVGWGDSKFAGSITYAPNKKIQTTVELIDEI